MRAAAGRNYPVGASYGLFALLGVANGLLRVLHGTEVLPGYLIMGASLLAVTPFYTVLVLSGRKLCVAVSETHVFARKDRIWVFAERARVVRMTRNILRESLRDADGEVVVKLPDMLSRGQGRRLAAELGVPHLDRHGRTIAPRADGRPPVAVP